MLDQDLAELYEVETKRLNEQVKKNKERFPADFMFQLTKEEFDNLKSQNATSNWGGRRSLLFAFIEHGVLMLSSVLKSKKSIEANIQITEESGQKKLYVPNQSGSAINGFTFTDDNLLPYDTINKIVDFSMPLQDQNNFSYLIMDPVNCIY